MCCLERIWYSSSHLVVWWWLFFYITACVWSQFQSVSDVLQRKTEILGCKWLAVNVLNGFIYVFRRSANIKRAISTFVSIWKQTVIFV